MRLHGTSESICPICGAAGKKCFETRYAEIDQCRDVDCSHLFADNPKLDAGVHEHDTIDVSIYKRRNEAFIKKLLRDGYIKDGYRVLDIGAGVGHIASELKRQAPGVDITCVEAAPMSVAHLRACGFEVIENLSSITSKPNGSFDFVFMIELIEHVPDPVRLLADCRAVMSPKGRILVTTPGGELRNKDHKIPAYDVPEHIQFFTVKSLRLAAKKAGFAGLRLTEMHAYHAGSTVAPLKWMKDCARSLRNMIQGKHHIIAVIQ
jgi:SAM-dependent methyltransferase